MMPPACAEVGEEGGAGKGDCHGTFPYPVLIGVGQYTQRKGASPRLDAVGMTAQASRLALADTGAPADRLARVVDCLYVVNYFC
jgi:hypothetical protein